MPRATEIALYVIIIGVLLAGTRFAVARPANWGFTIEAPGKDVRLENAILAACISLAAVPVAGVLYPLRVPGTGTPYITIAVVYVLALLLAWSATRSRLGRYAGSPAAAAAGGAWLYAPSWLTYSIAAAFLAFALIALVRLSVPFWWFASVQLLCAAWDFYDVIVTHATQAAAVLLDPFASSAAAVPAHPGGEPIMLGIPGHFAMLSTYVTAIGIGDIAMPGLLIVIAGRAGRLAGTPWLYRAGVIGYAIGLATARATGDLTHSDIPALCFLIPGIIIAVAVAAWRTGTWSALAGRDPQPAPGPEAAAA